MGVLKRRKTLTFYSAAAAIWKCWKCLMRQ